MPPLKLKGATTILRNHDLPPQFLLGTAEMCGSLHRLESGNTE